MPLYAASLTSVLTYGSVTLCIVAALAWLSWALVGKRQPMKRANRYRRAPESNTTSEQIDESMARLETWAKHALEQIDQRHSRLTELVREADRRIELLANLTETGTSMSALPTRKSSEAAFSAEFKSARFGSEGVSAAAERSAQLGVLLESGLDAQAIARKLGISPGEAELMVNLSRVRGDS